LVYEYQKYSGRIPEIHLCAAAPGASQMFV
jgi:hypothetical protein